MAIVYPSATGNWSTVGNWLSGGSAYGQLPQVGDDVYLDGKTITLDQNISVANIFFSARSGGTVGGTIACSTTKTITCTNIQAYSANHGISFTGAAGTTLTINANVLGATFNDGATLGCIKPSGAGDVNITGNLYGASLGACAAVYHSGSGTVTVTGNLYDGLNYHAVYLTNNSKCIINGTLTTAGNNNCIYNNSTSTSACVFTGSLVKNASNALVTNAASGTITINADINITTAGTSYYVLHSSTGITNFNGNITGGTTSTAYGLHNSGTGIINITGNITGGSVSPSTTIGLVHNLSTGVINISGNITGGTVANTIGVSNASSGNINVLSGSVTGGSNATNTPGILNSSTGVVDVTGTVSANTYPAIYSFANTASLVKVRGNMVFKNGLTPCYCYNITISPSNIQTVTMQTTSGTDRIFATSNISVGAPTTNNVRKSVVYGSNSELTGTLEVPSPADVRRSILTDNTVGTADLTASDMWNKLISEITVSGSIGERLKNCSTIANLGDQLASL